MSPGQADDVPGGLIEEVLRRGALTTPPADDESVLLTFLFADIRGYTKFTQVRGDEAAQKLTAKFAVIVRELVEHFGGMVFELHGDEAMCVFVSPRQSLRLAVALQQRFVEETLAEPGLPMTVGIGVDAGEAVRGPDGYRGGALNLAARLCARATAGEVLATSEVTHLARAVDGLRYRVLDRVTVKGLDEPIRPVRVLPVGEDPAQQLAALLAAATASTRPTGAVAWLPGPLARRPKAILIGAALLAAAVATTVVVAVNRDDGPSTLTTLNENSLGIIDPSSGRIVGQVPVGDGPVAAAAGFGSVWTANTDGNSVSRVDTTTHQVTEIPVGSAPSAIATGPDAVWVSNGNDGTVTRIDPKTNTPQAPIKVGSTPGGIAVGRGSVWVTNSGEGTVSRIDPALNKAVESIDVGDTPRGIAVGRDVWVANSTSNSVSKINGGGTTHAAAAPINVGHSPTGIAVTGDTVWVTNALDGNISRIPTSATSVLDAVRIGPQPAQLAAVGGHVWIAMQTARALAEVASSSTAVGRTVALGPSPGGLVAATGRLWVTTTSNPALHRGGALNLTSGDIESVDPTYLIWPTQGPMLASSYDGLVGFRHAGGADGTAIVADLATELPTPTDNGRTYTFHVRDGIHWSTGKQLTVFDVRHGIERAIAWPNTGLAQQIVGGDQCRPNRCHVRGVIVDSAKRTVTIHLVRPNGAFLNDIATATAVPVDTPLAEGKTRIVAATGPYQVASYRPGKSVVLTRNRFFREWSAAAQPAGYPDRIELRIDVHSSATRAADEVATGKSDWTDISFGSGGTLGALEARFGTHLHVTPALLMQGLSLNTQIPPFDDVRVRQALAYTIDRRTVASSWGLPASITCQFLPPNYPGYRPYCPYTLHSGAGQPWTAQDVPRAEAVIGDAKTRGDVTIHVPDKTTARAFGSVFKALAQLGYRPHITVFEGSRSDYFEYVADSRNKVQLGYYGWVVGGVGPAAYFALWSCNSFVRADGANNSNPAGFCDPAIDRLRRRAEQAEASSPAAAGALWAEVDRRMVQAAPWIPLVHASLVDVVSKRVHNYKLNPFIGVLFDQMWVR